MRKDKEATRASVVKELNKLFKEREANTDSDRKEELISIEERYGYLDPANICMFVPKKKWVEQLLPLLFEVTKSGNVFNDGGPALNWRAEKDEACTSKYSCEYLAVILTMTKHYDAVTISTRKDYPLRVETEDFIYCLAPRIDCD